MIDMSSSVADSPMSTGSCHPDISEGKVAANHPLSGIDSAPKDRVTTQSGDHSNAESLMVSADFLNHGRALERFPAYA
nr:hypothetical protein CFP56_56536 [Quercus suber]